MNMLPMEEKEYLNQIRKFKAFMEENHEGDKTTGSLLGTTGGSSTTNSKREAVAN